jgi:uncharacterized membrane protein
MFSAFIYIPLSFLYIIPMQMYGKAITKEQTSVPKRNFAIYGGLDAVSALMATFAVNYIIDAPLLVLLQQAAIPISMATSKLLLKSRYTYIQYGGALVVMVGLVVVLLPSFSGGATGGTGQLVWFAVMILSCVPMCLSSVYKEQTLGEVDMDVVYLNGWIAVFQFATTIPLSVPSFLAMGRPLR